MSSLVVEVAEIRGIQPHPNADNLELAQVNGWQVVVQKGKYAEHDKITYFPIDTLLPIELSDRFGITQYLSKQRIRAARLRGEPSFGLVMPVEDASWEVGQDVAAHYGVTKWEPPVRESHNRGGGKFIEHKFSVPRNPLFAEYTGIENMRHYPDLFLPDEYVVITEKIHGTNSRIGMVNGEWLAGSHHVQRGEGDELYWSPRQQAEWMVSVLAKVHKQVILFGEIYGSAIQSLDYGIQGSSGYRAFDLMIDGSYVDQYTFDVLCLIYKVPAVPRLYTGEFSLEKVRELAKGPTTMPGAAHMREGVVVKPIVERTSARIGRAILKYVSDDYLLAKKTDFKEE